MDVQPRLLLEELKQLERAEKDAGKSKRLRVVILAMEGWTAPAVAMAVGLSRRVCQHWVYRFNEQGLAGLEDGRGRQPTSPLTSEQEEAIRRRIDAGPTAQDGICSLRGADIRRFLQQEFGLLRSLAGVYHLLHRLGYSYLRPRPRHRKADPEAVEAFRQAWPERLQAIAAEHPASVCSSTSRMSRASANREQPPRFGRRRARGPRSFGRPSTSTCGCWEPSAPKRATPKDF